jgi:two-component system, NtrC family, response regulator AtoC
MVNAQPSKAGGEVMIDIVVYTRDGRLRFSLPNEGTLIVGRSQEADIRLDHRSISRKHVRFHMHDGIVEVEDISSRNGTWLFTSGSNQPEVSDETSNSDGDRRLDPQRRSRVNVGDMLRVGSLLLRLQPRQPSIIGELRPANEENEDEEAIVHDPEMRRVYEMATRFAKSDISILVLGETGVGKDVLSRNIHRRSLRKDHPFVRINCAALAENLLESELFGHERGAFTGAAHAKEGLLESANKGTVLFDEIGEMPLSTQVKLLNVLETSEMTRVGATRPIKIDVRFIGATNRDLEEEVRKGRFRKDLFFRINAVTLRIAPLRERPGDIEALARRFLTDVCKRLNIPQPELSGPALTQLRSHSWPGNVRELKHAMERAPLLCGTGPIEPEHLAPTETGRIKMYSEDEERTELWAGNLDFRPTVSAEERERVIEALRSCRGNQTQAAELLGISRRTLVNRLNQFSLPRPRKRG